MGDAWDWWRDDQMLLIYIPLIIRIFVTAERQ